MLPDGGAVDRRRVLLALRVPFLLLCIVAHHHPLLPSAPAVPATSVACALSASHRLVSAAHFLRH